MFCQVGSDLNWSLDIVKTGLAQMACPVSVEGWLGAPMLPLTGMSFPWSDMFV